MDAAAKRPTAKTPTDNSDNGVNNRLFFRLVQCSNLYERGVQKKVNVTSVQGAVLGALSRNEDRSMPFSELVTYLAVSRQNLDAVLKRMEGLGHVERVEGLPDRRMKIVRMTDRGHAFWNQIFREALGFYSASTAGISIEEKKLLTSLLIKIAHNLRGME